MNFTKTRGYKHKNGHIYLYREPNPSFYADDIILVASTIKDAQLMLDEVRKFGYSHQIKFNPTKTSLLIYNPKKEDKLAKLVLCNEEIIRTNSVKYLGNELADNYSNKRQI